MKNFLECYDHYFNDVYRYVFYKTNNKWDTEDLVSEIFRKAYEKFTSIKEKESFKAWIMVIARNTVVDHYRKKGKVQVEEDMQQFTHSCDFEDSLEVKEELECLKKSLKHLSDSESEIINLRYFSEMKFGEISELLKQPETTIRVKTMRIMRKLGILISNCLGGIQ